MVQALKIVYVFNLSGSVRCTQNFSWYVQFLQNGKTLLRSVTIEHPSIFLKPNREAMPKWALLGRCNPNQTQINCLVLKNTCFKPRSYTLWTIDRTAHVGTISTPLCSCNRQGWGSQIEDGRALWNQTTQNCKSFQLICLVVELLCLVDSKFYTDLKNSSEYHVSIFISRWLKAEVFVDIFGAYHLVINGSTVSLEAHPLT